MGLMFHEVIFTVRAATFRPVLRRLWFHSCVFVSSCYDPMTLNLNHVSKGVTAGSHCREGVLIHFKRADKGRLHLLPFSLWRVCLEANMPACAAFISGLLLKCLSCVSHSSPSPVAQLSSSFSSDALSSYLYQPVLLVACLLLLPALLPSLSLNVGQWCCSAVSIELQYVPLWANTACIYHVD